MENILQELANISPDNTLWNRVGVIKLNPELSEILLVLIINYYVSKGGNVNKFLDKKLPYDMKRLGEKGLLLHINSLPGDLQDILNRFLIAIKE